ncbi:glycosyltransferase [Starkeya koreensis]|uniref:Glycosyltransferase n=1 Tax=Ancylobacter koreensis TaxID=266121 RepID=A0ABT0DH56_9HYPH|nr:glycosyltransferase [Ancylobacter koreensis]
MSTRTAVITVNYFSAPLIHEMEARLGQAPDTRIIVVDNSGEFSARNADTLIVRPGRNVGFGAACNAGVRATDADIVVFLNPDAVIEAEDLVELVRCGHVDAGEIWGPAILSRRGTVATLRRPGRLFLSFRRDVIAPSRDAPTEVLYISGACMVVGRASFLGYGGFDENIFMYGEDLSLCLTAARHGARMHIFGSIVIDHSGGRSSSSFEARWKRFFRSCRGHYTALRSHGWGPLRAALDSVHLASGRRI